VKPKPLGLIIIGRPAPLLISVNHLQSFFARKGNFYPAEVRCFSALVLDEQQDVTFVVEESVQRRLLGICKFCARVCLLKKEIFMFEGNDV
jgi:hypothetical protein